VLRALAKDPAERYRTAAEMDSDLERIARGVGVSAETAEAATSVLSRTEVTDALTTVRPAAASTAYTPGRYYEYDTAPRRRSIWPWLLALLLLAGSLVGGYYLYERVQDQLSATAQVTVPDVVGLEEELAVMNIREEGLEPNVRRAPHSEVERGVVFSQDPEPPVRMERGNFVTILVSSGKPKVQIPNVVGRSRDDAVAALRDANLRFRVVEINSDKAVNSVTAQAPKAGEIVVEGTQVRINVSKGPKPIPVPNVVGMAYESAASVLQGSNFAVAREDVEDDAPTGTVVAQSPAPDTLAGRGATVTLQVSIGPSTSTVPDVTSQDEASARDQITEAGFRVRVRDQETTDESLDGIVISQEPQGGSEVEPNTIVTLFVGRLVTEEEPPPPPTTTTP
jgi:serine/threonine-protein kinase